MIECIFTLDYEICGNGTGALRDLVYEPAHRLREVFCKWNARFVNFVEVAEFEQIDAWRTDPDIDLVKRQIKDLHRDDFEMGLHLHPQWCNAVYEKERWTLDASEYNLCTLPRARIVAIIQRSLDYTRHLIDQSDFTPLSFRAGNWLFQPTETAAGVLAENGIKIDSSVFKGGVQHHNSMDYRAAQQNPFYWRFSDDVNRLDPTGAWIEVPIYTEVVPFWRMLTSKRMSVRNHYGLTSRSARTINRARDCMRIFYPMKLDFCRMMFKELIRMMGKVIKEDQEDPDTYRPVVAIGHTKDAPNTETVDLFLSYLRTKKIRISTFENAYPRLFGKNKQIGPCM